MTERASKKGIWSWMLFDWAGQPFHTLVITFMFAPYFASELFATEADGQAVWGYLVAVAGILVALSAPILGGIADRTGPRKPWVLGFGALFVAGSWGLWWASPDLPNLFWIYISFVAAFVGAEYMIIFTNSILPDLVPRKEVGKLSGYGWAIGYVGGVLVLFMMLLFMVTPPGSSETVLGNAPLFGLDPEKGEGFRASGPISAVWFIVFAIPFFLFTPDKRKTKTNKEAVREEVGGLRQSWQTIKSFPQLGLFFLSSMLYRDALVVLYSFGAIYAAGALGWGQMDLLIFGIVAAIAGALGAWLGGWVDGKKGPMPVVIFSICALILVTISVLMITKDSVFMVEVGPDSSLPTIAFIICGAVIGAAGGSMQASSRTLVVQFVDGKLPMTEAFGIYAMAGKATAFIGPALVALVTDISDSQRIGLTPVIPILIVGLILLWAAKKRAGASA
ncbi:MAG: MFS transporter [Rhodobacteraceae bacterium]|nr:MFS transporter [Paracoccaceae bacterium]